MSNITVNRQGPEAFQDNESGYHDSYTRLRDAKPQHVKPIDYRTYAVWIVGTLVAFLVFFIVYSIWKFIYCFNDTRYSTCKRLDTFEPFAFVVIFLLPILLISINLMLKYWTRTRYENALANRANLVLNRYGDQEPADLFDRLPTPVLIALLESRYSAATGLERAIAPHKQYRGVNSLSLAAPSTNVVDPLLTQPETTLQPIGANEWLQWLNDRPHILLGAATGEGKSTTAKAILATRIERGDAIFVIDPHSDDWYGLPVRGGGENWQDVSEAILEVYREYEARQNARYQYLLLTEQAMPVEEHAPLTVVVDEAFLIAKHLNVTKKGVINYWQLLTEVLGSGARKVNISVILLAQSTNVEDLDLSGPMRRNFTRVALDAATIKTMIAQEERDVTHRQALYEALIGMRYPATTVIDARVMLLDRTGLDTLARQPIATIARERLWSFVRSRGAESAQHGHQRTNERSVIDQLVALRRQRVSRERARREYGLTFTDSDWTLAGTLSEEHNGD